MGRRWTLLLLAPLALATFLTGSAGAQNRYFDDGESGFTASGVSIWERDGRTWGAAVGASWKGRVSVFLDRTVDDPAFNRTMWSGGAELAVLRMPWFMLEAGYARLWREEGDGSVGMIPVRAAVPIPLGPSLVLTPHVALRFYTDDTLEGLPDATAGIDLRISRLVLLAVEHSLDEDPIAVDQVNLRAGVTLAF